MSLNHGKIYIDKTLEELLPPLSKEDYNQLKQSLITSGFKKQFGTIKIWFPDGCSRNKKSVGYIVDGHNRFKICKECNIKLPSWCFEVVFFDTKESVIKWMYENQLARRNLSDVAKYEIVEKYNVYLKEMAKKNQSDGGKGLSNLTKVNVRKEKADRVGISEGSYHKLDKVMKSDNEGVKQQLRDKKVSINQAYQEVKSSAPKKEEETPPPQQQIAEVDNRMNEIEMEISSLNIEKENLMRKRTFLFDTLDIGCELKYEFINDDLFGFSRTCYFYIELDGHKEVLIKAGVFYDKIPFRLFTSKVPEKYKNDFLMLWEKAHEEEVEDFQRRSTEWADWANKQTVTHGDIQENNKDFYKKCFRILAKNFHPDNEQGDMDDMKSLNQLKQVWGI